MEEPERYQRVKDYQAAELASIKEYEQHLLVEDHNIEEVVYVEDSQQPRSPCYR